MSLRTVRTDFAVVNALGVTLYTSNARDIAIRWLKSNAAIHGALIVEEVVQLEQRRVVYRPRRQAQHTALSVPDPTDLEIPRIGCAA